MKKTLPVAFLALLSVGANAQCVPDQAYANSSPGVYPATVATVDCSDTLSTKTIVSITDTMVHVTSPLTLDVSIYYDSTRVMSVTGVPSGLTFGTDVDGSTNSTSPFGAWVNGGTVPNLTPAVGCVYIRGGAAAWAAAAAGGIGGTYTLEVEYDARIQQTIPDVSAFGIPNGTWLSQVDTSLGGGSVIFQIPLDANPTNTLDATVSGATSVDASTPETYSAPSGASSYAWVVTGGTIQSGQGSNQISVIWDGGNTTGNVSVTVGDGTCTRTDDLAITSIITAINSIARLDARIFPNPSNGSFSIQTGSTDPLSVEILDVTGKLVVSQSLSGANSYPVNIQAAPAGVYMLRLENANGIGFRRLIKQ